MLWNTQKKITNHFNFWLQCTAELHVYFENTRQSVWVVLSNREHGDVDVNITYRTVFWCGAHRCPLVQSGCFTVNSRRTEQLSRTFRIGYTQPPEQKGYNPADQKRLLSTRSRKHQSFLAVESSNEICHGTAQLQRLPSEKTASTGISGKVFKNKTTKTTCEFPLLVRL